MLTDPQLHKAQSRDSRLGEQGFSVVEIVIAMVIFLVVTGSIWGLMQTGLRGRQTTSEFVQLTKSVRIGLNLIGRDTYNAGLGYPISSTVVLPNNKISNLLGIPADTNPARDTAPPIIPGNNITLNTFNTTAGVTTDQVTFLYKDTSFNLMPLTVPVNERVSQAPSVSQTNVATPLSQDTTVSVTTAQCCVLNDLYLVQSSTGATLVVPTAFMGANRLRFAVGDPIGFNVPGSTESIDGITPPATIQKVQMVTYFVTADGILTRRRYVNNPVVPVGGWFDEPLVYGVENFQIQYVMNDGTLSDNPTTNLAAVRQVRYTISVRSVENGSNNQPFRETMTSTFSTRNMGYETN